MKQCMASESPYIASLAEDSAQNKPDSFKDTTATDGDSLSKLQVFGHPPSSSTDAINGSEASCSGADNELATTSSAAKEEEGNARLSRPTPPHSPAISLNSEACMARAFNIYEQDALDFEKGARENGHCQRSHALDNDTDIQESGTQAQLLTDRIEAHTENVRTALEPADTFTQQASEVEEIRGESIADEMSGPLSAEENQMTQAEDMQFMQNGPFSDHEQRQGQEPTFASSTMDHRPSSTDTEDHDVAVLSTIDANAQEQELNIPANETNDEDMREREQRPGASQNIPEGNAQSNRQEASLEEPMSQTNIPYISTPTARHSDDDHHHSEEQRISDNIPDSVPVGNTDGIPESDTTAAQANDREDRVPLSFSEDDGALTERYGTDWPREVPVDDENGRRAEEEPEIEAGPPHWPPQSQPMNRQASRESDQTLLNLPRQRVWEADRQAQECRRCNRRFNFLIRRHHCRRCGQVVCDRCSSHRIRLPPEEIIQDPVISRAHYPMIAMHPQRVCDVCVRIPVKETSSSSRQRQGTGPMSVGQMKRTGSSQSIMTECPVCGTDLLGMHKGNQEKHLQTCLNSGSPPVRPPRYIVYTLSVDSPQIGYECPICFEEFEAGQKIARMICLCSYHQSCLADWLERGKGCPVHFDSTF